MQRSRLSLWTARGHPLCQYNGGSKYNHCQLENYMKNKIKNIYKIFIISKRVREEENKNAFYWLSLSAS